MAAPFRLTKSSLPTLLKALSVEREKLASLREQQQNQERQLGRPIADDASRLRLQLVELKKREDKANAEIAKLLAQEVPKSGLVGRLFGLKELPKSVQDEIVRQRLLIRSICDNAATLQHQLSELIRIQFAVACKSSRVSKLESEVEKRQRKKDKLVELKAAAAANANQTRMVATSIKKQMEKQPNCPYCNGALGDTPHADHIYPVAKGGRSVPRNMVWVCAACNIRKRDLTLTGFIKKYQFDRTSIEARLEILGKDY